MALNMKAFFDDVGGFDNFMTVDLYAEVKFCGKLPGGIKPTRPIRISPTALRDSDVTSIHNQVSLLSRDITDIKKGFHSCMIHNVVCLKRFRDYIIDESLANIWKGLYKFGDDIYNDIRHLVSITAGTIDFVANTDGIIRHVVLRPNLSINCPKHKYEIWIPMDFLQQTISGNYTYKEKLIAPIREDFSKLNDGVRIISVINFLESDFRRLNVYADPKEEYILRPMEMEVDV